MAIKPILFSTPMVKAILEERKTQTRRIIKPKYCNTNLQFRTDKYGKALVEMQNNVPEPVKNDEGTTTHHVRLYSVVRPKFNIGDTLWVRETWDYSDDHEDPYLYREKYEDEYRPEFHNRIKWKPSIFMPKEACRMFLKVTGVGAERLQDITEGDACAEGVKIDEEGMSCWDYLNSRWLGFNDVPEESFKTLWQSINGFESWDENPWVWVYEFEITEKPKDFCNA